MAQWLRTGSLDQLHRYLLCASNHASQAPAGTRSAARVAGPNVGATRRASPRFKDTYSMAVRILVRCHSGIVKR